MHELPRNTFPFLRLEMAPPAAPVAFCGKQMGGDQPGSNDPRYKHKTPLMILVNRRFASAEKEVPHGYHFVRNRCLMSQLPGRVTREGEIPRPHRGQN